MPRLFFHLVNGQETILDHEGVEVAPAYVGQINKIVDEVRSEEPELPDTEGWCIEIVGEDGARIATIPLNRALSNAAGSRRRGAQGPAKPLKKRAPAVLRNRAGALSPAASREPNSQPAQYQRRSKR